MFGYVPMQASSSTNGRKTAIVVVFGRPGAGKTTVTTAVESLLRQRQQDASLPNNNESDVVSSDDLSILPLDLDVCIPQWMKDNFAAGIYPNLQERQEFAVGMCNYIDEAMQKWHERKHPHAKHLVTLCSFSFVNQDLRDIFRKRFPEAIWVLINTSEAEAQRRINEREGHFYKGKTEKQAVETGGEACHSAKSDSDNSEWDFAPVTFPHTALDGNELVDRNAEKTVQILRDTLGLD